MIERQKPGEKAVLVHIDFSHVPDDDNNKQEFIDLVYSAGAQQVSLVSGTRLAPAPKTFVGSGKAEEILSEVSSHGADLVVFNHALSPSQQRNLERLVQCRVIDRTGLILDLFAQRARSHEGKLQVELAQLRYLSTRLIRGWTHLERQKGGIGLRGPGETQLETDRRLLSVRIKQINKRLEKVRKQRQQSRQARHKATVPTVSLVGYTNAGKSSLFNALTRAGVFSADQLFATLDPTLRRYDLANGQRVVLADTVGFIRQLPHDLVAAFHATLQETRDADLLMHVIDANGSQREDRIAQVNQVLTQIGADRIPQLLIFNKIDLSAKEPRMERDHDGRATRIWLSAKTGEGLDLLQQALAECFPRETVHGWLSLPPDAGRLRARLFALGAVVQEQVDDAGSWQLEIEMPRRRFEEISRIEGLTDTSLCN